MVHDDSNLGIDDNGNPTTIEAAKMLFHKNNNPFYFKKMSYINGE
jgi:hypothetical protein